MGDAATTESTTMVALSQARKLLEKVTGLDDVLAIRDRFEALRYASKEIGEKLELQNLCAEGKIRAERKAGNILREMPKHPAGRPSEKNRLHRATNFPPTLKQLGIEKTESHRWQVISKLPDEFFETYLAEITGRGDELTSKAVYSKSRAFGKEPEEPIALTYVQAVDALKKSILKVLEKAETAVLPQLGEALRSWAEELINTGELRD